MPTTPHAPPAPLRLLLTTVVALALAVAAAGAQAQSRAMGKPSAGSPVGKPGWSGNGSRGWHGGNHGHWHGGNSHWQEGNPGYWRGGWNGYGPYSRGYPYPYWRGYYGGRYYYPGWAVGLGVGVGLSYPWWGWYPSYGYPATTVVYERAYDAPVGVVVERQGPAASPPPAADPTPAPVPAPNYRWYCPSPAGYHPEVRDCAAGWLRVLPEGGVPPELAPRSSAPIDDDRVRPERVAPPALGGASTTRIAAPRMTAPAQFAGRATRAEALAHLDAH